jgi:hypothetical protein
MVKIDTSPSLAALADALWYTGGNSKGLQLKRIFLLPGEYTFLSADLETYTRERAI